MGYRPLALFVCLSAFAMGCVTGSASTEERALFVQEICAESEILDSRLFAAIAELEAYCNDPGTFVQVRATLAAAYHQVALDHAAYVDALEGICPADDADMGELHDALQADGRRLRARWEMAAVDLRMVKDGYGLLVVTDDLGEWLRTTISTVTIVRGGMSTEFRAAFATYAGSCGSLVGILTGSSSELPVSPG